MKATNRIFKMFLILIAVCFSLTSNAQNRRNLPAYNPYAAEKAYWDAYNQSTQSLYRNTQRVKRAADATVNYGSYAVPGGGRVRVVYNATDRYIQRRGN